jgi:hypothetical protein
MAIQSGGGEYASIDSSDKKSSSPANSEAYQNMADLAESTSGAPVMNELSIEDAIGTYMHDQLTVFPPKNRNAMLSTLISLLLHKFTS